MNKLRVNQFEIKCRKTGSQLLNRENEHVYEKPENGKIIVRPKYPSILSGMRNISLTSLAGQMHNQGYSKKEIYQELLYANKAACTPPLPESEVQTIVNSVSRYRRKCDG